MATNRNVNGVDAGKLREAARGMQSDASLAKYAFRAHSTWAGGLQTKTTIDDFRAAGNMNATHQQPFKMAGDEPVGLLGQDTAPNATEAALHALACCLTATFMYHAALRDVEVDDLRLDLEGNIDLRGLLGLSDQVPVGFQNVEITFHVRSDAPREQVEELCGLAQKHSPVYNTFTKATPTSARVDFMGGSQQRGTQRAA